MSRWLRLALVVLALGGGPSAFACILVDENGKILPDEMESSDGSALVIATFAAFAVGGAGGALANQAFQRKRDK